MVLPLPLLLLAASVVKDPGADLRKSCAGDAELVASIPSGAAVTIRYGMSGQSIPCYRVTVETPDGPRDGYLLQTSIANLEEFDAARRGAARVDPKEAIGATGNLGEGGTSRGQRSGLAGQAIALIEAGQPARALSIVEAELKANRDPGLLAVAGVAAWRSDDPRRALGYWKESLAIRPDAEIEELYSRVEREMKGDQSNQRFVGMRVLLRYEGTAVTAGAAREMAAALDREFGRVSARLGCSTQERIVAIAQSEEAYRKTTGAAEWSGGQFDGRIRVPVFDGSRVDANLRKVLAHEMVHACLGMLGQWPAWVQEGVAQYVSGEVSSAAQRAEIAALTARKAMPKLSALGQSWGGFDARSARLAYTLALRAIEVFEAEMGAYGLRNLLANPERLPQISVEIERRLGL